MKQMALSILQQEEGDAFEVGDYILCFHVPPFNSVDHLHLHVLAPASQMNFAYKYGKYLTGTPWCLGLDELIQRLEERIKECALKIN
jgi:diadenosine tetraphosphate (Ap4A) HIT family hydrolase